MQYAASLTWPAWLGLKTVAEFVETAALQKHLDALGMDLA